MTKSLVGIIGVSLVILLLALLGQDLWWLHNVRLASERMQLREQAKRELAKEQRNAN